MITDPDLQARLVAAEEHKAAALIRIADQLPALIEALSKSRSYGGGGKKKDAVGFYPFVPDLKLFQKNDTIHVPATSFARSGDRVNFFSPFNIEGMIAIKTEGTAEPYRYPGAKVGSIKIGTDAFKRVFGEWNPADTGQPVWFKDGLIKILTISIGVDKDDPNKHFSFIVGQKNAETSDPLALQFTPFPQPAAQPNGNQ